MVEVAKIGFQYCIYINIKLESILHKNQCNSKSKKTPLTPSFTSGIQHYHTNIRKARSPPPHISKTATFSHTFQTVQRHKHNHQLPKTDKPNINSRANIGFYCMWEKGGVERFRSFFRQTLSPWIHCMCVCVCVCGWCVPQELKATNETLKTLQKQLERALHGQTLQQLGPGTSTVTAILETKDARIANLEREVALLEAELPARPSSSPLPSDPLLLYSKIDPSFKRQVSFLFDNVQVKKDGQMNIIM